MYCVGGQQPARNGRRQHPTHQWPRRRHTRHVRRSGGQHPTRHLRRSPHTRHVRRSGGGVLGPRGASTPLAARARTSNERARRPVGCGCRPPTRAAMGPYKAPPATRRKMKTSCIQSAHEVHVIPPSPLASFRRASTPDGVATSNVVPHRRADRARHQYRRQR